MDDTPQTWHYGLMARWWAEFNTDGPEIDYFKGLIMRFGEPALDVGCGTGRLLIPFLRAGLDVDGCDISPDMLALCAQRAEAEGFRPQLFAQAMHQLSLPRRYRSIVVCGAFGIGGSLAQDQEALHRLFRHLAPGGAVFIDYYVPYKYADEWHYWVKEEGEKLPEPWPSSGQRKITWSGEEIELRIRLVALDPLEQVATRQMQAILWRGGQAVQQEEQTLLERLYFRNELLAMLAAAGFRDVEVRDGYTDNRASPHSGILVYIARKE